MKQKTIITIIEILNKVYGFRYTKQRPFKVLIGVVLSQRTNDDVSVPAAARLLKKAKSLDGILKLAEKEIEKIIYPTCFFKNKAKRIKEICRILKERYNGKVPDTREELMKLPGVGPKSTSIILASSFAIPTIAVDVHVNQISQRLGIVPNNYKPEKTQEILENIVPENLQIKVNHLFVTFGRKICKSVRPHCAVCPIYAYCKYEKKEHYRNLPLKELKNKMLTSKVVGKLYHILFHFFNL